MFPSSVSLLSFVILPLLGYAGGGRAGHRQARSVSGWGAWSVLGRLPLVGVLTAQHRGSSSAGPCTQPWGAGRPGPAQSVQQDPELLWMNAHGQCPPSSQGVQNPQALLTALLPNIVLSFPALAWLTKSIKTGWHLEPLKEKKKKISGIPELLIQKNLARISKACSTRAAGLVPIGHWLVPEK